MIDNNYDTEQKTRTWVGYRNRNRNRNCNRNRNRNRNRNCNRNRNRNRNPNWLNVSQVNKNYLSAMHVDKNNFGPSYIVGVGDYTAGALWIQSEGCLTRIVQSIMVTVRIFGHLFCNQWFVLLPLDTVQTT